MSYSSNYLKLRAEREKQTGQNAGGETPPASTQKEIATGGDSFSSRYLELRKGRLAAQEQELPATTRQKREQARSKTTKKQGLDSVMRQGAARYVPKNPREGTASGLLEKDAVALRQQREAYQKELNAVQADRAVATEALDTRGLLPEEAEGLRILRQAQAAEQGAYLPSAPESDAVKVLKEKIAAIDARLVIYDRVDALQNERVTPLKSQSGFATAKRDYVAARRNGAEQKAQQELDRLNEELNKMTWNKAPIQYMSDPDWQTLADRINELEAQMEGLQDSEFDDYMRWWDNLSEQTRQKILNHEYSSRDFERSADRVDWDEDFDTDIWDVPSGYQNHWERMTEDEVNAYYYIANTEGMAAAKEFLEELQFTLDRRHTLTREQAEQERIGNLSAGGAAAMGALTVGENLIGAPVAFASNAVDRLAGREFNPYSNGNALLGQSGNIRGTASANIQNAVAGDGSSPFWNGVAEVTANVYQAALSTMDSLAGMATMGQAYTVSMGMGAASTRMRELYESGATDKEIYMGAIGSGILEALFEKVSLDRFADSFIRDNPEKWIKKMLLQSGVEGSEEVFTEISNKILDALNRGINSDHSRRVRELMNDPDNPMSREEAQSKAACEDAMDVFWAGFGGLVSGGMSAVGGAVIEQSHRNEMGKYLDTQNLTENDIQALVDEGLDADEGTVAYRLASEIQEKLDRGEKVSGYDVGLLWNQMQELQPEASWEQGNNTPFDGDSATEGEVDSEDRPRTLQEDIERQWGGETRKRTMDKDLPWTFRDDTEWQRGEGAHKTVTAAVAGNTAQNENEPLSAAQRLRENQNNGGNDYGVETGLRLGETFERARDGVSDGSGQRDIGAGAGKQAGQLEKGTEQRNVRAHRTRTAIERQNLAGSLRLPKISSLDLGIKTGTEARTVQVLPQEHWDDTLGQLADRIYNETGKQVTYVVGKIQVRGAGSAAANVRGVFTGEQIFVQADNMRLSAEQIADHEAYHAKADFAGQRLNNEMRTYITERFSEEEFDAILEKYIVAMRGIIDINEAGSRGEYEDMVRRIEEELFADAYAGINAFGAGADQFTEAVNERMGQFYMGKQRHQDNGTRQTDGPPAERYSYAGENARTADLKALEQAKQMREAGVADEMIRRETGWYTGMDGKWRWEIDDSAMRFDSTGDRRGAVSAKWAKEDYESARDDLWSSADMSTLDKVRAYNRADLAGDEGAKRSLYQELINGPYAYYFGQYADTLERAKGTKNAPVGGTLEDYIDHPELFEAYPELKEVGLRFDQLDEGYNGFYDRQKREIVLSDSLIGSREDTLIHEIQHAIQAKEGFARGSNTEYWKRVQEGDKPVRTYDAKIQKAEARVDEILGSLPANVAEQFRRWSTMNDSSQEAMMLMQELGEGPYGDAFNDYFMEMWTLEELKKYNHERSVNDLYRNTAGEIEARDAADRRGMNARERKNTPPKRGDDRTVFAEETGLQLEHEIEEYPYNTQTVIQEYVDAVDDAVLNFADEVQNGQAWRGKKVSVGTVSARMAMDVVNLTGIENTQGCKIFLNSNAVEHIQKRHGANGTHDNTMRNNRDIARIDYILRNYDSMEKSNRQSGEYKNRDGSRADVVILRKKIDGTYFVIEAVPDTGKFGIVSAYMNKNGAEQVPNDNTLGRNVRNELATTPGFSLANEEKKVKDNNWDDRYSVDDEQDTGSANTEAQRRISELMAQYQQAADRGDRERMEDISGKLTKALREVMPKKQTQKKAKPVAESKPTESKRELRKDVLSLFSVPEGQKAELGSVIDSYAERLLKNGTLTEEDRQTFFDRVYEAGVMTVPADEYYAMGREYLVNGRVYVPDNVVDELGDDWNELRRRAFRANVYLTRETMSNGRRNAGIDTWNADLASDLPGLFDEDETDQRSILERIIQVAEEGKDEKMSLPEYTAWLAGREQMAESEFLDGMERKLDEALRTFAKEAALEIKLKDRTGVKIAREREKFASYNAKEKLRQEKQKLERREATQRAREQKELRELQQKTLKQLQWLSKNQNRAPEDLKARFDEILGDIDLFAVGAANEMRWSEKHNATWKDLTRMYKAAQKNDPNFLPSQELERIVARLDNEKIGDMDVGALQDLYKAAIGLRTEFYNRNNVINDETHRLFSEVYTDAKTEIETAPGGYSGKWADRLMNLEQLTPMNVMQRMGGWNPDGTFYSMAKQLEAGERDMRAYTVKAKRMLQEFLEEYEDFVKKADGQGKDAIWYEVEVPELLELGMGDKPIFGPTVKVWMTPAQKVHMYLESKNYDNLRHMTGGRTFANKELYSDGKRQEAFAQGRTIRLAPETVKALVSDLTAEEMELARLLERYYNTFATQEINRVSNTLYGYDKAMGKNYAPIYTNKNYTKSEFGVFDSTAEGVSNLKGRQYSTNPSYSIGAFDAFERHVDQTARFVGMAIPARNWTTLMNWRTKNNSTGDVITHKWGEEGKNYITDLITGLQSGEGIKTDTASSFVEKLQSNYISAVFGANPSIVLKQLGSIPLASVYLGGKNLPSPKQIANIDRDLISKYTQDLEWRTLGYSMPETKFLKDNPNWTQTNKFFNFTFGGGAITAMDGWAASVLWPWAENKIRKEFPDLEVGTKTQIENGESPFYKKVAEEFNDAVARSQSTSDEIHQGTLRKSKNPFAKVFTMFRSDSAQTYNAIRQKIGEAQYYARVAKSAKPEEAARVANAAKLAKRAAGNAVVSMIAGYVLAETVEFLMNLWKHQGKRYRDDENELTAKSVAGEMVSGLVGDVAGVVVFGEELYDAVGSIVTGTWNGIDTMGLEQLNDLVETLVEAGSGMLKLVSGGADILDNGGDLGEYFRKRSGEILGNIKGLAQATATYLPGLPVNNLEAYLLGTVKWVSPELGAAYDDLFTDVNKNKLSGLSGDALTRRILDVMKDRKLGTNGETAQALAELYEADFKGAVPGDTPSSISVNGEERKLSAYQKQVYEKAWGEAVSDGLDELVSLEQFARASEETREKMLKNLYAYGAEKARSEVFDDYELDSSVEVLVLMQDAGLSLADGITWKTDTSGKKQTEKFQALRNWNLSEKAKKAVLGTLIGTDLETESGKPSQYAKLLDVLSWGGTVNQYLDMRLNGTDIDDYLELTSNGMDEDLAFRFSNYMEELKTAGAEVDDLMKWRASVDFSDDVEDQLVSLSVTMNESQFRKVEIANDFGVAPDTYVRFYEIRDQYDADGNGSYKQSEVKAVIDGEFKDLSTKQKAALWQIMITSKSAKKNPYSRDVGQQVLDAKEAAKDDEDAMGSFSDEVNRQIRGEW